MARSEAALLPGAGAAPGDPGDDGNVPERIRLRRTKGWRKPEGAIVVARPSRWGNPYRVGIDGDRAQCVRQYRDALGRGELAFTVEDVRRELTGHDLACWCPLEEPCHADVLLEACRPAT